jgi:hypothetical protein
MGEKSFRRDVGGGGWRLHAVSSPSPIFLIFSFQMFKDDACDGPTLSKVPKCPFLYMNAYVAESKENMVYGRHGTLSRC